MKKTAFALFFAVAFIFLIGTTLVSAADTKILDQRVSYCLSGEEINGGINQGERVEVNIRILLSEERELSFFSELSDTTFYLGEKKISENSSLMLKLPPGTSELRTVGVTPTGVPDAQEIILLGCDTIGSWSYIRASIISPYIRKEDALTHTIVTGFFCAVLSGILVFLITKGKLVRMKTVMKKKSEEKCEKIVEKLKAYLEKVADNLTIPQKREAKELAKDLKEILKWQ